MKSAIYEFLDSRGQGVIEKWREENSQDRDLIARLDQKLDALEDHGRDLPPKLLDGTKYKHVDKLRVYGKKTTWRFMVTKERVGDEFEFTFLFVAQEKDRKLIPKDAYDKAEDNREVMLADRSRRRLYERDDN